jgi:hypothetical protein
MSILVQTVVDRLASRLDAEASDRYDFDLDYLPAINSAMEWVVTALNPYFAAKKFSAEGLRELVYTRIFQTNAFSRVSFDPAALGHPIWSILGVYPNPVCNKGAGAMPQTDPAKSLYRNDVSFISSDGSCQRMTAQDWNNNVNNSFEPGNQILTGQLSFYGYRDFSDYSSTSYSGATGFREIGIRPNIKSGLVAVEYIKYPTQIALITDSIGFSESMTEFITDKALNFVSWKQGSGTDTYGVSENETKRLLALLAT